MVDAIPCLATAYALTSAFPLHVHFRDKEYQLLLDRLDVRILVDFPPWNHTYLVTRAFLSPTTNLHSW
jgi:hypothetical protein